MHQSTGLLVDQVMACHMFGAKFLSGLMLTHHELDPKNHISMKFHYKLIDFFIKENIF